MQYLPPIGLESSLDLPSETPAAASGAGPFSRAANPGAHMLAWLVGALALLAAAALPDAAPWALRAATGLAVAVGAWWWLKPLRRLQQQLQAVLDHAPVGIAFGRNSRFELVSSHLARMLGRPAAQLHGQATATMYASADDRADLVARAKAMFEASGACDGEVRLVDADGRVFWGRLRGRAVQPGRIDAGTIWIIEDISHTRAQQQQLAWAAQHDALTGLVNRRGFEARLKRLHDEQTSYCALYIDLDHFKQVNDRLGHAAGDRLLSAIGRLIAATVRDSDTVARLGGDEFAVLLPGCPPTRAQAVAESIIHRVGACRLDGDGTPPGVGASIGLVQHDGTPADANLVIKAADDACYAAKRAGRGRVAPAARP